MKNCSEINNNQERIDEIAEMLGVNESTSKSQYSRARAYLRERIEKIHGKQR